MWVLITIVVVTLALSVSVTFDLFPALRGPNQWRWPYVVFSRPLRHLVPAVIVMAYVVVVTFWGGRLSRAAGHAWERRAFLLLVVLSVPVIQASLYAVRDPGVLEQPFYRTVSPRSSGVFTVGSAIDDPLRHLQDYQQLMPTFPIHPRRYPPGRVPPGRPLPFYGARSALELVPQVSRVIASPLRRLQCHNLPLMRMTDPQIASSRVQLALPVICGLTILPICGLARRTAGKQVALWAAALYPLVPSFNLWFARWDAFYALLAATTWLLFYVGLVETRWAPLAASGLLLSVVSWLSFGCLALLLPMISWGTLWLITHRDAWSWKALATGALAFGVGLMSVWVSYRVVFGVGFLDVWRASMSEHVGLGRSYWVWVGYHIYDFFAFLGAPLVTLFLVALWRTFRGFRGDDALLLPIGFALGLILIDLSGMSQGEAARVWLFLTPFVTIAAASGLEALANRLPHVVAVFSLLAVQLLAFNASLSVVNTRLYDPPERQPSLVNPAFSVPWEARFGDRIRLLGYDVSPQPFRAGDTIELHLFWQPFSWIHRTYTVFAHLVTSEGELVAQQDTMPVRRTLPTTCWVPGEVVRDPYEIEVPEDAPRGDYRLETGLYLWPSGDRLLTSGEGAAANGRVILREISTSGGSRG